MKYQAKKAVENQEIVLWAVTNQWDDITSVHTYRDWARQVANSYGDSHRVRRLVAERLGKA